MPQQHVLVIDDDPGAVEAFEPMLKCHGYGVRTAVDAESGFCILEQSSPSAIILDLHLPTIDGLEVVRRLRSDENHARRPIAVVTGDYLIDDRVTHELQTLGVKLFFKPLWEEDLLRIVQSLIKDADWPRRKSA
jgi:two-component system, OmpR family, response regulator